MKTNNLLLPLSILVGLLLTVTPHSAAATLAGAAFDADSYIFVGTNNEFQYGISTFTDDSLGVLDSLANSHFNFAVIKFDDLAGIQTVANGGPQKFLTLETMQPGNGTFAFSVAGADIHNGYPTTSGSFNGPAGSGDARLQWYFDNIKGDDATFGGYAGGADHIGVLNVAGGPSVYSLDVTAVVDAWIDGTTPNHGFGVWAVSSSAAQGSDLDFASMENPITGGGYFGPRLTSIAVPEPATVGLVLVGMAAWSLGRRRKLVAPRLVAALLALAVIVPVAAARGTTIPIAEDVMTSSFFQGTDLVRGYTGDARPTFRVSTTDPFGTTGAETIYLTFDASQFAGFSGAVPQALLTLESKDGGFGANASAATPFTVSAHAVDAEPLSSITDDTNPSGPTSWLDFLNNNILPADAADSTAVDGFGPVTFDVTSIVNSWIAGTNSVFAIALTGKNDTSGNEFLHGFANNAEAPGSTFITIVPEPAALALGLLGAAAVLVGRGRRERS
jgi:hypothetical protein